MKRYWINQKDREFALNIIQKIREQLEISKYMLIEEFRDNEDYIKDILDAQEYFIKLLLEVEALIKKGALKVLS